MSSRLVPVVCVLVLLGPTAAAQDDDAVPRFKPGDCAFKAESPAGVDCGELVVYENRSDPAEGTLRLAVAILRSTGDDAPAPDPLVYLTGGPGTPAVTHAPRRATSDFWGRYRETRDVVFFDQRGTGFSEPHFCPEMDVAFTTVGFRDLSPEERQARRVAAARDCRKKMQAKGVDFSAYNSAASARDLDDLREALGYDQWNLFGLSYGTRLALTAMRDTPAGIRSVILDSTVPLDVRLWVDQPQKSSRSLNLVFEQCANDAACRAAFPALETDFYALLDSLEQQPIEVAVDDTTRFPDGRLMLDDGLLANGVVSGLYSRHFISVLPLLVREIEAGNKGLLKAMARQIVGDPHAHRMGLQKSINCYEVAPFNPPAMIDSAQARHSRLALSTNRHAVCDAWHDVRAGSTAFQPVESDIPTLILSGKFDPVTPPSYGRRAAETLSNSTFVEVPAVGHAAVFRTECTRGLMASFLKRPAGSLDTGCVDDLPPASFVTDVHIQSGVYSLAAKLQQGPGVPLMAGLGLMALLLLSGVLAWPVGYAWQRFRGRRRETTGWQRGARWGAALASLGALGFLGGLAYVVMNTVSANPFVLAFGVPGDAGWLFLLPWVVAALTGGALVAAVWAWRQGWWTTAHRVHYALVAAACIGFVVFVGAWGLW